MLITDWEPTDPAPTRIGEDIDVAKVRHRTAMTEIAKQNVEKNELN